jgi:uncharacterized damage-inducible protein DinB
MNVKDLETLYDYGYWANGKLRPVLSQLSPEQFTQVVTGSYGSIRNTLVHMLSAEWGWLDRCGGTRRGAPLDSANFPTVASLFEQWDEIEGHLRRFLASLREEDLARPVEFAFGGGPTYSVPLGLLMQHAANHGVHHRGQVALLLRSLGLAPGNVDFLYYCTRPPAAA